MKFLLSRLTQPNISELEFLGFKVNATGYQPDPPCLKQLVCTKSPRDQSHRRRTSGCLQYCSRFIVSIATRGQPLFLAQSSDEWRMTDECERTVHSLISDITDGPMLTSICNKQAYCAGDRRIRGENWSGVGTERKSSYLHVPTTQRSRRRTFADRKSSDLILCGAHLHKHLFGLKVAFTTDQKSFKFLFSPNKSVASSTATVIQW